MHTSALQVSCNIVPFCPREGAGFFFICSYSSPWRLQALLPTKPQGEERERITPKVPTPLTSSQARGRPGKHRPSCMI